MVNDRADRVRRQRDRQTRVDGFQDGDWFVLGVPDSDAWVASTVSVPVGGESQ